MVEDEQDEIAKKWEYEAKVAAAMACKANKELQLLKKELAHVMDMDLKLSDEMNLRLT